MLKPSSSGWIKTATGNSRSKSLAPLPARCAATGHIPTEAAVMLPDGAATEAWACIAAVVEIDALPGSIIVAAVTAAADRRFIVDTPGTADRLPPLIADGAGATVLACVTAS